MTIRIALAFMACGAMASAQTITFDDLGPSYAGTQIPNGYAGFDWNNFYDLTGAPYTGTGYSTGVVSPGNVAFNDFGNPASFSSGTEFNLTSAYVTSAFLGSENVEVEGFNGATKIYDTTYTVTDTGPTLLDFNYNDITSVTFVPSGGGGSGEQLVFDNVTIDGAAAPGGNPIVSSAVVDGGTTSLLLGGGLLGLGFLGKKLV